MLLPPTRLSLNGGRLNVVVDGGPAARPSHLRALARVTNRVAVLQMPQAHDSLDWLLPIAPQVEQLAVFDTCQDLSALQHFPRLQNLTLRFQPHAKTSPMERQAVTLHEYSGPWFPALDLVLASPVLTTLTLEQPPHDVATRATAPLQRLRLLSAHKLAAVPALACTTTLTSLEIAGGKALDLTGITAYTRLASLDLYGRTPLTSFAELARCPSLRRLFLEECYAVDDIDALRRLTLDELRIVGRPENLDPDFLRTARNLGIRRFSAPRPPAAGRPRGEDGA